jgi:hypothetical protein
LRQVKGSLVKPIVKQIKANKSGIYDTLLSDEAKKFIKQNILDSLWYSFESYKECSEALYKVEAKNDPAILNQWGKLYGELLFTSIYKSQVGDGSIKNAIEKYRHFLTLLYNFSELVAEFPSDNQVILTFKNFDREWENFYYILLGWVHKYVELSIKKEVTSKIIKKSWEGADATQILVSWAP